MRDFLIVALVRRYYRLIGTHTESRGFHLILLHEEVSSSSSGSEWDYSTSVHIFSHCERRRCCLIVPCHFSLICLAGQVVFIWYCFWSIIRREKSCELVNVVLLFVVCCDWNWKSLNESLE